MAAGKFGGFPWDPGEISITFMSELPGDYEGLEPWPPPDHHSSRASCLRRRGEMSWVGSTVHAVNSIRVQILGKVRLDARPVRRCSTRFTTTPLINVTCTVMCFCVCLVPFNLVSSSPCAYSIPMKSNSI